MKRAKQPIKVNFNEQTIVLNRAFATRAAIPTSKEYHKLKSVRETYPDYEIQIRTIVQPKTERHKGLTYSYMEHYISTHENATVRMAEFREMRLRAECHSMKYNHIKKWFLSVYPQIDDFTPEDFKREQENVLLPNVA